MLLCYYCHSAEWHTFQDAFRVSVLLRKNSVPHRGPNSDSELESVEAKLRSVAHVMHPKKKVPQIWTLSRILEIAQLSPCLSLLPVIALILSPIHAKTSIIYSLP